MLNNSSNFNPDEAEDLFGRSFVKEMVKSADTVKKLASLGQPDRVGGCNRSTQQPGQRAGTSGSNFYREAAGSGYGDRNNFYGAGSQRSRGGFNNGRSNYQGRASHNFDGRGGYVHSFDSVIPLSPMATMIPVTSQIAGRIRFFCSNWSKISNDPWVLSVVSEGLKLEFTSTPFQLEPSSNMQMSNPPKEICDREVAEMVGKGAVGEVSSQGFVSGFFLVPKSDGSWRPIINLKGLNNFLVYRHFKMEGLNNAKHLVKPGCWMAKIDLKDAYFTVPLHQADRHLLQFRWGGKLWQFTCMAFGLASAPWTFTKLVKPIVTWLRARGIKVIVYLDDFFFCADSKESLLEHLRIAESILEGLGFVINRVKSVLIPHHGIEFVGFVIDSIAFTISLPLKKRSRIVNLCEKASSSPQVSLHDLASLLGLLSWASIAVDFAQSHY
jgi:hypothetical protein